MNESNKTGTFAENKIRVLLVEDNAVSRKVAMKLIQNGGLECNCAENGQEALTMLDKENYDIILMDCQMPVMDGFEATRKIREQEKQGEHMTIIALTANAFHEDMQMCIEAGMDDYLTKPIDMTKLHLIINYYKGTMADNSLLENERMSDPLVRLVKDVGYEIGEARDFLLDFIDYTLDNIIKEMETAISNMDISLLKRYAHSLKGTALNLNLTKVHGKCIAIEELCSVGDVAACSEMVQLVRDELVKLKAIII